MLVDREKVCPFLLRVFYGPTHHDDRDYGVDRLPPARDEHVLYTWKDTTMRDLIVLLLSSEQGAKVAPQGTTRYSVRHVYMDEMRGHYTSKDIGLVFARDLPRSPKELRGPPGRTLDDIRFVTGDYLDIAFLGPPGVGVGNDAPRGPMRDRDRLSGGIAPPRGPFADRDRDRRPSGGGGGGGFGRGGGGPRRGSRSPSPRRNQNGADGSTWRRD